MNARIRCILCLLFCIFTVSHSARVTADLFLDLNFEEGYPAPKYQPTPGVVNLVDRTGGNLMGTFTLVSPSAWSC